MDLNRRDILADARTVVVKLGTQLLSARDGRLDLAFMGRIASQVARLQAGGARVTLVSSGAIGAGLGELSLPARPKDLPRLQAVAAVGQRRLMDAWGDAFEPFGLKVAQILLTRQDVDHRVRFLNLRNTLHAAHDLGAVPVINENDTISTDELVKISFGDNDILAAMVAAALQADLLVLLTVVDGLLDGEGRVIPAIRAGQDMQALVRSERSPLGKGGMNSKLEAARMVCDAGEPMVIANGRADDLLPRLLAGEPLGTLFLPAARRRSARGRWIGAARAIGAVIVDDGAAAAVAQKNRSLLPAGVRDVEGDFARGDVVAIRALDGRVIARGLSNYSADDLRDVRGRRTGEIRRLLGERAYDEVVHRDNLIVEAHA